ncbi:APC family permease [Demequina lignilytica]|uniref:APC family permease n=1 Tax=Demequina lignilytica TaxID=3051663 RepID=A0AB35MFX9_9MICO|nr:APC family permease [Demequina sp. SYSU T0a273]MDN4482676.1 APC family permease [Demequina sp. SYSU T0a273]
MSTRRVGLVGATAIGVGSMLGAGVFVVWGPAASLAGALLPAAVLLAGLVALLNAGSTAQLAAVHPVAGGAYAYGRAELGAWPGFLAGAGFVLGKTASVAAVALAIGRYLAPDHAALVATAAIAGSWLLNSRGVTRTAGAAVVLASVVVAVLVVAVYAIAAAGPADTAFLGIVGPEGGAVPGVVGGVMAAAALVFFAFAGYARIATLGEEVSRPARTIPWAIAGALAVALTAYLLLSLVLPARLGEGLVASTAPIADAVDGTWLPVPVVTFAAVAAAAGSLLALTAGVGRTAMAMAREGDLPRALARVNGRGVPALAEAFSGLAAIGLVWVGSLTFVIAMSSFAVLLYYAVAGAAAFRAAGAGHLEGWRMPRLASASGTVLCVLLMIALPWPALVAAVGTLALAAAVRMAASRASSR